MNDELYTTSKPGKSVTYMVQCDLGSHSYNILYILYIKECGSTLYVGLQQKTPPANTKFRPSFLRTPAVTLYTKPYMQKASYLKSTVTFLVSAKP